MRHPPVPQPVYPTVAPMLLLLVMIRERERVVSRRQPRRLRWGFTSSFAFCFFHPSEGGPVLQRAFFFAFMSSEGPSLDLICRSLFLIPGPW